MFIIYQKISVIFHICQEININVCNLIFTRDINNERIYFTIAFL